MGFENKDQKSDNTPKDNFGLEAIKKVEVKEKVEAPKMVSIALDGYKNRVFMSEEKIKCFGIKSGPKFMESFEAYNALSHKEKEAKLKEFRK
jgi:hypothetical protein